MHRACGGDIPCLDDRLRLIMIGMNNPRTERRDVQRGKDRVLACQEHRQGESSIWISGHG